MTFGMRPLKEPAAVFRPDPQEVFGEHGMILGFTTQDLLVLQRLIGVTGYSGRVKDFTDDAIAKGIPPLRDILIAHHEKEIAKLKAGAADDR